MSRYTLFLLSTLLVSIISVGCCGPACGIRSCNDCDGIGYGEKVIPRRPFDRLRSGKSLFCGSGCGEVYVDEWLSNPPDCCDPCDGPNFIGQNSNCHNSCRSTCWQPGDLLRRVGSVLAGGRYCTGAQSSADCGCGGGGCGGGGGCSDGSCGGGVIVEHGSTVQQHVSSPVGSSSCGCSSASATPVGTYYETQTANRLAQPKRDPLTTQYR